MSNNPLSHMCIEAGESSRVNPALLIDDPMRTLAELEVFVHAGGRAIVDAQPVGCGRNACTLKDLSLSSGVHVIASTGFHRALFYPNNHWIHSLNEEALTALFIRELTEGMYIGCDDSPPDVTTGIRAGQIKTALETGSFDARSQALFAAAAQAARATGAPIMTHVERGSNPEGLADFLEAQGLPPNRVIFCHMDRAVDDLNIHLRLLARGAWLEYDTIGRPKYHGDDHEIGIISKMADAGYAGQLLAGLDVIRNRYRSYGGQIGLGYILRTFMPRLITTIGKQRAQAIFTSNPSNAFALSHNIAKAR